jgi:hypothetical protein
MNSFNAEKKFLGVVERKNTTGRFSINFGFLKNICPYENPIIIELTPA